MFGFIHGSYFLIQVRTLSAGHHVHGECIRMSGWNQVGLEMQSSPADEQSSPAAGLFGISDGTYADK